MASTLLLWVNSLARANDIIYFKNFDAYADKSSLMIQWGTYGKNIAIKISFGPGLAGLNGGVVFNENVDTDKDKIAAAKIKLAQILHSFKDHTITVGDHLTKSIGLTFKQYIKIDEIK